MLPNPQPNSPGRTPLWIIAFSLLTIAICLVALVFRSFIRREKQAAVAVTEPPNPAVLRPERVVRTYNPARAASTSWETDGGYPTISVVESATQTVVQTSQTIVITPPLRGLALGAVSNRATSSRISGGRGSLTGRVHLTHNPPPEIPYDVTGSPECRHLADDPPTTQNYVLSPDGGLSDVLVWLKPDPPREMVVDPAPQTKIELTFTNCELQPRSVAILPWYSVRIRNSDATKHVLQIRVADNFAPMTEVALSPGAVLDKHPFKLFGTTNRLFMSLRCGLHPWEQAYVSFARTPYVAITDSEGRYVINHVPAGTYQVEAFHRLATGAKGIAGEVKIDAGVARPWNVGLQPRAPQPGGQLSQRTPGTE